MELLRREQVRTSRPDEEPALIQAHGPDVQIQLLQQSLHSMQQVGPPPSPWFPTCRFSSSQTGQTGVFLLQQVLSLQEKLRSKEAELEQVKEEHHCLEGQVHVLQAKVCSHRYLGYEDKRVS